MARAALAIFSIAKNWPPGPGSRETQVLITVDYGGLSWRGHVGVVTTLFKYARLQPARSVAMVCGPEIMMRFVIARTGDARPDAATTSIFPWNAT